MDMSKLELTCRANYLIYDYIKKQLQNIELAEQFRKVVQQNPNSKDIIIFKGLEDLLTVLKMYYSGSPAAVSTDANGQSEDQEADAMPADCNGTGSGESAQKKKKKKKQRKSEPAAESEAVKAEEAPVTEKQEETVAEPAAAVPADAEEKKSKKKKKKRQLEAAEQPDETANGQAETDEAQLKEAEPEAAAESEEAPKSKKRKKQRREVEEDVSKTADEECSKLEADGQEVQEKQTEASAELNGSKSGKNKKRHNEPYRRVREDEVINKHFRDNSFDAKPGAASSWGYKANEDLKPTQGRSFRHEKTKKKRGSYKGGAIDTGVCSIRFESDSE
ncbi:hypothetical protein BOX15_Mlig001228g10 [Macrostomum lignano]|uniref:Uncharacterized protein n=2 Tax=Macrostomum lignano TaxID=282301 RepID=A0A267FVM0_9PLAT|nr:hypothetical protein BOX15_Mlig001228g10 [Macrostomum lignano]